jgi:hypothetical protein
MKLLDQLRQVLRVRHQSPAQQTNHRQKVPVRRKIWNSLTNSRI